VLLPVLGDHLGREVERGAVRVQREGDGAVVVYHEHRAPLSPESLEGVADVDALNRDHGALLRLLRRQHHRLARWRLAMRQLNWRRFFDISTLVALRAEEPAAFTASHALVLGMLRRGEVDGVRVDHVDGLRDPRAYLRTLRGSAGSDAWVVVEKILAADETLPASWDAGGTTGYEFGALVTRLLTDPSAEAPLLALHAELGGGADLEAEERAAKLQVMQATLRGDVDRLALLLRDACAGRPRHADHGLDELRDALAELLAALPVYRTYAVPGEDASPDDVRRMRCAVERVAAARPDIDRELLDLLCTLVTECAAREGDAAATELVQRMQQLSCAVMARGVEDTAFYRFTPLAALDEVGCGPRPFSAAVEELHQHNLRVQQRWPQTLLATTTHDTKRSEDVRARLVVLAEMPERWADQVRAWRGRNTRHRRHGMPDGVTEHLLYQSMVGAWPVERERMLQYMEKASREAKLHTSWTDPDPAYDAALRAFVEALYGDAEFLAEVEDVVRPLVTPGRINALAATLLKLASPGVPDLYQGTELWTLTLVDPDNRRPVDYGTRRRLAEMARSVDAAAAWREHADSGLPKLLLTHRALAVRRRWPELFGASGTYHPLRAGGPRASHVIAFARGVQPGVVALAPRLPLRLSGDWAGTTVALPPGEWHDQLCGRTVPGGSAVAVAELLQDFPVALLAREPYAEEAA